MEERKPISHITAGLIIAGLVVAISMVMMLFAGNNTQPGGGWITYLIIIGGLIYFINQHAKAQNNQVGFGELFSYGFKATSIITLVMVLFLVMISLMFPDFKAKAMEIVRTQMENQKGAGIDEDKIDEMLQSYSKYFWVFVIGGTMLAFVIVGAIGSLLGAALSKKRPHNPFEQQPL